MISALADDGRNLAKAVGQWKFGYEEVVPVAFFVLFLKRVKQNAMYGSLEKENSNVGTYPAGEEHSTSCNTEVTSFFCPVIHFQ